MKSLEDLLQWKKRNQEIADEMEAITVPSYLGDYHEYSTMSIAGVVIFAVIMIIICCGICCCCRERCSKWCPWFGDAPDRYRGREYLRWDYIRYRFWSRDQKKLWESSLIQQGFEAKVNLHEDPLMLEEFSEEEILPYNLPGRENVSPETPKKSGWNMVMSSMTGRGSPKKNRTPTEYRPVSSKNLELDPISQGGLIQRHRRSSTPEREKLNPQTKKVAFEDPQESEGELYSNTGENELLGSTSPPTPRGIKVLYKVGRPFAPTKEEDWYHTLAVNAMALRGDAPITTNSKMGLGVVQGMHLHRTSVLCDSGADVSVIDRGLM
jgi:hypothetical protein